MPCGAARSKHRKVWSCLCDLYIQNILDHDPFSAGEDQSALKVINFLQLAGGGDICFRIFGLIWDTKNSGILCITYTYCRRISYPQIVLIGNKSSQ